MILAPPHTQRSWRTDSNQFSGAKQIGEITLQHDGRSLRHNGVRRSNPNKSAAGHSRVVLESINRRIETLSERVSAAITRVREIETSDLDRLLHFKKLYPPYFSKFLG